MANNNAATSTKDTPLSKDPVIGRVHETHNYDKFTLLRDNRDVNPAHVARLAASFYEHHLVSPVIVNDKLQVIDGQHRLAAAKETGKPIHYIVIPEYGIDEVQVFNSNQKNWTKRDFLEMFVAQRKKHYIDFKEFMAAFPDLEWSACEALLTNTPREGKKERNMRDFQNGKFTIPNLAVSYKNARRVMEFQPFYEGFTRRAFVAALLGLFKTKAYDHKEMIYKLGVSPKKLEHQTDTGAYREALEDIYNWKRLKENRVSFKYV
jgi:hypothetical protein